MRTDQYGAVIGKEEKTLQQVENGKRLVNIF
jgi:hypothetical protein